MRELTYNELDAVSGGMGNGDIVSGGMGKGEMGKMVPTISIGNTSIDRSFNNVGQNIGTLQIGVSGGGSISQNSISTISSSI